MEKATEWRRVLREQKTSGKSAAAFCRERGISEGRYQYWRARLQAEPAGKFVRVGEDEKIELELPSGVKVRLSAATSAAALTRILEAVDAVDR